MFNVKKRIRTSKQIFGLFCLLTFCLSFPVDVLAQSDDKIAVEYMEKGDYEKAAILFAKIVKKEHDLTVYENYRKTLIQLKQLKDLDKYIKKQIKNDKDNLLFAIDLGLNQKMKGDENGAKKYFSKFLKEHLLNPPKIEKIGNYFLKREAFDYAIQGFLSSRKALRSEVLYVTHLTELYQLQGKKKEVINEYLNLLINAFINQETLSDVQNHLQNVLLDKDDYELLITSIYPLLENYVDNENLLRLMAWGYLQQNDFYNAFVQLRALDKKHKVDGKELMNLGNIALENKEYSTSIEIFNYLASNYPNGFYFVKYKKSAINARKLLATSTYPINSNEIVLLIDEYETLLKQTKYVEDKGEIIRSQALLYAFYLNDYTKSVELLKNVVKITRLSSKLWANSTMDLADIYILIGEPWESTLLYFDVEKTMKNSSLSHLAKYKNAKLSYYKGDFDLAQSHLDILKLATTREIANDAMDLSLLIQNNTALDTSTVALKKYSEIDLLVYKKQYEKALLEIDSILDYFNNHHLTDELYWLQYKIYIDMKKYNLSVEPLKKITQNFSDDILADNAFFSLAKLYDEELNDQKKAMEYYKKILTDYSGSIYVAESRKRFRSLRGDFRQ